MQPALGMCDVIPRVDDFGSGHCIGTGVSGIATYSGSAAGKAVINPQLPGEDLVDGAFTTTCRRIG